MSHEELPITQDVIDKLKDKGIFCDLTAEFFEKISFYAKDSDIESAMPPHIELQTKAQEIAVDVVFQYLEHFNLYHTISCTKTDSNSVISPKRKSKSAARDLKLPQNQLLLKKLIESHKLKNDNIIINSESGGSSSTSNPDHSESEKKKGKNSDLEIKKKKIKTKKLTGSDAHSLSSSATNDSSKKRKRKVIKSDSNSQQTKVPISSPAPKKKTQTGNSIEDSSNLSEPHAIDISEELSNSTDKIGNTTPTGISRAAFNSHRSNSNIVNNAIPKDNSLNEQSISSDTSNNDAELSQVAPIDMSSSSWKGNKQEAITKMSDSYHSPSKGSDLSQILPANVNKKEWKKEKAETISRSLKLVQVSNSSGLKEENEQNISSSSKKQKNADSAKQPEISDKKNSGQEKGKLGKNSSKASLSSNNTNDTDWEKKKANALDMYNVDNSFSSAKEASSLESNSNLSNTSPVGKPNAFRGSLNDKNQKEDDKKLLSNSSASSKTKTKKKRVPQTKKSSSVTAPNIDSDLSSSNKKKKTKQSDGKRSRESSNIEDSDLSSSSSSSISKSAKKIANEMRNEDDNGSAKSKNSLSKGKSPSKKVKKLKSTSDQQQQMSGSNRSNSSHQKEKNIRIFSSDSSEPIAADFNDSFNKDNSTDKPSINKSSFGKPKATAATTISESDLSNISPKGISKDAWLKGQKNAMDQSMKKKDQKSSLSPANAIKTEMHSSSDIILSDSSSDSSPGPGTLESDGIHTFDTPPNQLPDTSSSSSADEDSANKDSFELRIITPPTARIKNSTDFSSQPPQRQNKFDRDDICNKPKPIVQNNKTKSKAKTKSKSKPKQETNKKTSAFLIEDTISSSSTSSIGTLNSDTDLSQVQLKSDPEFSQHKTQALRSISPKSKKGDKKKNSTQSKKNEDNDTTDRSIKFNSNSESEGTHNSSTGRSVNIDLSKLNKSEKTDAKSNDNKSSSKPKPAGDFSASESFQLSEDNSDDENKKESGSNNKSNNGKKRLSGKKKIVKKKKLNQNSSSDLSNTDLSQLSTNSGSIKSIKDFDKKHVLSSDGGKSSSSKSTSNNDSSSSTNISQLNDSKYGVDIKKNEKESIKEMEANKFTDSSASSPSSSALSNISQLSSKHGMNIQKNERNSIKKLDKNSSSTTNGSSDISQIPLHSDSSFTSDVREKVRRSNTKAGTSSGTDLSQVPVNDTFQKEIEVKIDHIRDKAEIIPEEEEEIFETYDNEEEEEEEESIETLSRSQLIPTVDQLSEPKMLSASESESSTSSAHKEVFFSSESYGTMDSELIETERVRQVKRKVDSLITEPISPYINNGIRIRAVENENGAVFGRLALPDDGGELQFDSEISELDVEFDTNKTKFQKSPIIGKTMTRRIPTIDRNDKDFSSFLSTDSSEIYTRDISIDAENDEADDPTSFDIKTADSDDDGSLLQHFKKNAIILSSSSDEENEKEHHDRTTTKGGITLLMLSSSSSEEDEEDENGKIKSRNINLSKSSSREFDDDETPEEYEGELILKVTVIEARNLPQTNIGPLDPFCILKTNRQRSQRTKTIRSSSTPIWDQQFCFDIHSSEKNNNVPLVISVFSEDKFVGDREISTAEVSLKDLKISHFTNQWIKLMPSGNLNKGGEVHITLHLEPKVVDYTLSPRRNSNVNTPKDNSAQNSPLAQDRNVAFSPWTTTTSSSYVDNSASNSEQKKNNKNKSAQPDKKEPQKPRKEEESDKDTNDEETNEEETNEEETNEEKIEAEEENETFAKLQPQIEEEEEEVEDIKINKSENQQRTEDAEDILVRSMEGKLFTDNEGEEDEEIEEEEEEEEYEIEEEDVYESEKGKDNTNDDTDDENEEEKDVKKEDTDDENDDEKEVEKPKQLITLNTEKQRSDSSIKNATSSNPSVRSNKIESEIEEIDFTKMKNESSPSKLKPNKQVQKPTAAAEGSSLNLASLPLLSSSEIKTNDAIQKSELQKLEPPSSYVIDSSKIINEEEDEYEEEEEEEEAYEEEKENNENKYKSKSLNKKADNRKEGSLFEEDDYESSGKSDESTLSPPINTVDGDDDDNDDSSLSNNKSISSVSSVFDQLDVEGVEAIGTVSLSLRNIEVIGVSKLKELVCKVTVGRNSQQTEYSKNGTWDDVFKFEGIDANNKCDITISNKNEEIGTLSLKISSLGFGKKSFERDIDGKYSGTCRIKFSASVTQK